GLQGDWQRNRIYHGGPDKAVLMIASELVDELSENGYPVTYGSLGVNLTVTGLDRQSWRTGHRYRTGDGLLLELTTQRVPCLNLNPYGADRDGQSIQAALYDRACKANDVTSPRWANGGFYARVIKEGVVFAGAPIELIEELA